MGSIDRYKLVIWLLAGMVLVPLATIFATFLHPEKEIWAHLVESQLTSLLVNSLRLCLGVGLFTLVVGVSLGWLTGACDFYGRRFFSWSLALPMAIPGYVMAFIFLGIMDFSGPIQGLLRQIPGLGFTMIEVRTTPFIVMVLGLTLYPYVYILSRSSFLNQGHLSFEAARTLGLKPWRAFLKVSLPVSRPWIVSGLALVLMETLADFGAVSIFNYDTFTTAIYKSWFGFFSLQAAAQLASFLVVFALLLVTVESRFRSKMRFYDSSRGGSTHSRLQLVGWQAKLATAYCTMILLVAFVIPLGQLCLWGIEVIKSGDGVNNLADIRNTLFLGCTSALFICGAAVLLSYAKRRHQGKFSQILCRVATSGYALPGTVLAVAIFLPIIWLDNLLQTASLTVFGFESGPLLQGSIFVVLGAYLIRFLAVGYSSVDSAMQNIRPSLDEAAAGMGVKASQILRRVHLPLLKRGVLTAMVLLAIDVIKEMPITLMTRPFGWDTLAVKIYELTSEGEWVRASLPGLYLVIAGIIPVFILIRRMEKNENG